MRKFILFLFISILIVVVIWWLISVFKKPAPVVEAPQKESLPLVTELPPDATDTLLQDNLDEALKDIEALE